MKTFLLQDMIKGWIVGNFTPSAIKTELFEVGVKEYKAGESEAAHVHKIATEITIILNGSVEMCGRQFNHGDIIMLEPNDITSFLALTDVQTVVIKMPSVIGDKYITN